MFYDSICLWTFGLFSVVMLSTSVRLVNFEWNYNSWHFLVWFISLSIPSRGGSRIPRRRRRQPCRRGRQPYRRGHQHTNLPDFSKNCMKLRKFGPRAPLWIHHCPLFSKLLDFLCFAFIWDHFSTLYCV